MPRRPNFKRALRQTYRAVDAATGGILPGGTSPKEVKNALKNAGKFVDAVVRQPIVAARAAVDPDVTVNDALAANAFSGATAADNVVTIVTGDPGPTRTLNTPLADVNPVAPPPQYVPQPIVVTVTDTVAEYVDRFQDFVEDAADDAKDALFSAGKIALIAAGAWLLLSD